jgi:ABC-2 type transport system permease protein
MATQGALSINSEKLRWLLWLRWKLFIRGYTRSGKAGKIVSTAMLGLVMLVGGGALAVGTWFAYRMAPAPINIEVLFVVLSGLYLIWLVMPVMSISLNEGLDVSKLSLFPLTRGELLASMLVSTLLDIPTVGLLLVLGAVVAGWATSIPLALLTFVVVLVFYVQLVALSQLILGLLQPLLHSRRFRDLSILLTVVIASSGYLCNLASRSLFSENFIGMLQQGGASLYLQWLPPGWAARSIQLANTGNWALSLAWLLALVVLTLGMLYVGAILIERGMTATMEGQGTGKSVRKRNNNGQQAVYAPTNTGGGFRWLPPQIRALLIKDLKYFWRDPQLKVMLIQAVASVIFLIVIIAFPQASSRSSATSEVSGLTSWTVLWAPNMVLFTIFALAYNTLGFERQSLTTLMLFPIPPQYILWAKNLSVALVGIVEIAIVSVIVAAVSNGWSLLVPTLAIGLAGLGVILGIGNFTSVFFPQKMRMMGRGVRTASNVTAQEGCLRTVVSLGAMIVMLIVLAPVIAAIVLPYINGATWIWLIAVPGAVVYGVVIYLVITLLVAPRILNRAPEITEVVARE